MLFLFRDLFKELINRWNQMKEIHHAHLSFKALSLFASEIK